MSIANTSSRECVRSKYFVSKTGMEESLSDFQETKPNCKGPKTTTKVVKPKARKVSKRIKGQKDIRTALKGKKNDLISYTKEFDNVCKKSGLDVDSEQLQVAIALSKSLQTETIDDASTSQSLTTQSRIAKIRTTLQEYGFKVPENKITTTNKRVKKHKKQYKLLNTTEEERNSTIRNKYSEVLNKSLDHKLTVHSSNKHDTPIYNVASNLDYGLMKNNDIFYVDSLANLIERSTTIGSLLRKYSEIPGRPVSPVQNNKSTMDFSEIICSQDELDVILSGPIKSAYAMIASKHIKNVKDRVYDTTKVVIDEERKEDIDYDNSINIDEVHIPENNEGKSPAIEITKYPIQEYRSCSPDIFDDEVISINEISKPVLSQEKTKVFTEETNCMDLTECVCVTDINFEQPVPVSINTTKRKSNDLMELTECAVTVSQGIHQSIKEIDPTQSPEERSVIKQNCHVDGDLNYEGLHPDNNISQKKVSNAKDLDSISGQNLGIDLTQNYRITYTETGNLSLENVSDSNIKISIIGSSAANNKMCRTPCDDIDLTQSSNEDDNILTMGKVGNKETESVDLTQSSKSSLDINELPEINVGNSQNNQTSPDDTIILNEEEYIGSNGKVKHSVVTQDNQVFDLTQSEGIFSEKHNFMNKGASKECNQSFYDDFIHDHSDSKENIDGDKNYSANDSGHNTSEENKDIDLTQSSNECEENITSPRPITTTENTPNNSSLGKRDDISIDYDEVCDNVPDKYIENNSKDTSSNSQIFSKCNSSKSQVYNDEQMDDRDNDFILNCSQNSEVFDLTDKELNYSLHKSRLDDRIANYNNDFGDISVIDTELGGPTKSLKLSVTTENNALDESFLPEVDIKQQDKCDRPTYNINAVHSSHKYVQNDNQNSETFSIVTPKNSKYIVKTEEVTPMIDYASLTTPQRNKELDKYGLKPFKRKRAIQILTHLYNQTHPIMEPYSDDDQPSSSKRPKHESNEYSQVSQINSKSLRHTTNVKSPRKGNSANSSKSPRQVSKNMESPRKEENSNEETVSSYQITSDVPNIKSMDCNPEDWVFQKREKAKVHGCRVPLHVAFHNYVSSRRDLREAILKYDPVNIDVIHKDLVSYGHRYDSKDLLRFLDKKCITVKTADNNARNKR